MKNILKSFGLSGIFFILHMAIQMVISIAYTYLRLFIDSALGVVQRTSGFTFLYKGQQVSFSSLIYKYSIEAAIPAVILTAIVLILIYKIAFKKLHMSFEDFIRARKLSVRENLNGLLVGVTAFFPLIFIISNTFIKDLSPETEKMFEQIMYNVPFVLQVLGIGIIGPVIEEITFRGLIFSAIRRRIPIIPAIIIQALLFGAMHMNMQQFIYASLLGVVLGLICEWSESLLPAVFAHIGFNTFSLMSGKMFSFLQKYFGDNSTVVIYMLFLIASVVLCQFFIHAFYKNKKNIVL